MAIERASFPNPWHETTFRGEIQNEGISFPLVASERTERRVVGYIIFWRIQDEIQINNIAVHPDFRGLGIGEAILREVPGLLEYQAQVIRQGGMATDLRIAVEPESDADGQRLAGAVRRALEERLFFRPEVVLAQRGTLPRFEMKGKRFLDPV